MLRNNCIIGNKTDVTICNLGFGDVSLLPSTKGGDGCVMLAIKNQHSEPIGKETILGEMSTEELEPDILFVFHNIDALNVFSKVVERCKIEMLKQ